MSDLDDNRLVELSLNGDNNAFDVLVKRYELQMYRTAWGILKNHETAKDITQSAFIKCWKNLKSFDPEYKFYSWLYRIIVNESLNYLRDHKTHSPLSLHSSNEYNPYLTLLRKEENRTLAKAIGTLSPDYQIVIQLRHFEGLSYQEMANILQVPKKTIKSRLYSARMQLRKVLLMN